MSGGNGLLETRDIKVQFDGVAALDGVSLHIGSDEIVGLIGPNGAGKTTLLNVLSGFQKPTSGSVLADGVDVTGMSPPNRARFGLARSFQSARLFERLTVLENLEVALVAGGAKRRSARREATGLLRGAHLLGLADTLGAELSHGTERMVSVLRGMACRPRYLLLDEPAAGLNDSEGEFLVDWLIDVASRADLGILVVDHDMRVIMRLCSRLHVLDHGKTLAVGPPAEVREDPAVLTAYLGRRGDA